ncbi:MAG: SDR family oxidoreductase [Chloroflexi bacterium]|nr:SDR family oxidoreductase [Chloroflexota bacterium]
MKLEHRVAIVTGASTGIGLAIAETFAREGARVAMAARSADRLERASQAIVEKGGTSIAISADISQESEVRRLVDGTIERFGRVDILVNNAALNHPPIDIADFEPELWRSIIDVNLTGAFLCCRAVLPRMTSQGSGKIINISSIGGRKGSRGRGAYRASKAGLISLTETLAAEVHDAGITVNCICPGGVETEMSSLINLGEMPSGLMRPEEIANLALFLASDESSSVTGTTVDAFGPSNPLYR